MRTREEAVAACMRLAGDYEDYPFDDKTKKVTLVNADPEINKSFNTYAITIEFKVENADCLIV